jgi:hypothetical protein|tara:strand:+ start:751 stop:1140 length:390 start_codon:yes stop_codon:yes gene_type:complete
MFDAAEYEGSRLVEGIEYEQVVKKGRRRQTQTIRIKYVPVEIPIGNGTRFHVEPKKVNGGSLDEMMVGNHSFDYDVDGRLHYVRGPQPRRSKNLPTAQFLRTVHGLLIEEGLSQVTPRGPNQEYRKPTD